MRLARATAYVRSFVINAILFSLIMGCGVLGMKAGYKLADGRGGDYLGLIAGLFAGAWVVTSWKREPD